MCIYIVSKIYSRRLQSQKVCIQSQNKCIQSQIDCLNSQNDCIQSQISPGKKCYSIIFLIRNRPYHTLPSTRELVFPTVLERNLFRTCYNVGGEPEYKVNITVKKFRSKTHTSYFKVHTRL